MNKKAMIPSYVRKYAHYGKLLLRAYVERRQVSTGGGGGNTCQHPIDFVVTWVDGNDPCWQQEKAGYIAPEEKGNGPARYREWGQFLFWFRSVERYAPWVRYVHLITWGHVPAWLNVLHPKLKIVRHSAYIPSQYLPTFSSVPIELNMHRIPDLSEHFVYFNDDVLLAAPVLPTDFFENGLPKHCAVATPVRNYRYNGPFAHQLFSVIGLINGYFDVYDAIERNPALWFHSVYGKSRVLNFRAYTDAYLPGMHFSHLGVPLRKTTMSQVWDAFLPELDRTSMHRFRTPTDIMHQIFSIWEIMNGTFVPVSQEHYGVMFGNLSTQVSQIADAFESMQHKMICLNDSIDITEDNFDEVRAGLDEILQKVFPQKSLFEK